MNFFVFVALVGNLAEYRNDVSNEISQGFSQSIEVAEWRKKHNVILSYYLKCESVDVVNNVLRLTVSFNRFFLYIFVSENATFVDW